MSEIHAFFNSRQSTFYDTIIIMDRVFIKEAENEARISDF